jgi:hypothetical protein
VIAEFNWWMLMVGLVVGAGLVWFVVADQRRREVDIDADERAREALWLSTALADEGEKVSPEVAERLLALHRAYLEAPPPDQADDADETGEAPEFRASPPRPPGRTRSELSAEDGRSVDRGAADVGE